MKESGEMYLENILVLSQKFNSVRAIDLVNMMGYSKPSVSRALSRLKDEECIIVDSGGRIAFTEKGRKIAEKIYERHTVLTQVLLDLGVDEKTAVADACKIEHDISDATFNAMKKHIEMYNKK